MRNLDRILLIVGLLCLGVYIAFTVQAHFYQEQMEETFEAMSESEAIIHVASRRGSQVAPGPRNLE
jgi:hypothetical protein